MWQQEISQTARRERKRWLKEATGFDNALAIIRIINRF